jgi:hypothetical protein
VFEIGNSLREARERQGLGYPEIELATKIRAKYIRALEEEDFTSIPGDAYIRGFLRTYAEYLGLDGDVYVDEYASRFITSWRDELLRGPRGGGSDARTAPRAPGRAPRARGDRARRGPRLRGVPAPRLVHASAGRRDEEAPGLPRPPSSCCTVSAGGATSRCAAAALPTRSTCRERWSPGRRTGSTGSRFYLLVRSPPASGSRWRPRRRAAGEHNLRILVTPRHTIRLSG